MHERKFFARCAEPNTEESFLGILRWKIELGTIEFDINSQLIQLLGKHHASFFGHKHGNFALFLNEAQVLLPPIIDTIKNPDLANIRLLFPTSDGNITVYRVHDRDGKFFGFHAYGWLNPKIS